MRCTFLNHFFITENIPDSRTAHFNESRAPSPRSSAASSSSSFRAFSGVGRSISSQICTPAPRNLSQPHRIDRSEAAAAAEMRRASAATASARSTPNPSPALTVRQGDPNRNIGPASSGIINQSARIGREVVIHIDESDEENEVQQKRTLKDAKVSSRRKTKKTLTTTNTLRETRNSFVDDEIIDLCDISDKE